MGRQLNLKPNKVFELVNNLGINCKSFAEVTKELQPTWSGYLLIDGKSIYVKKKRYALLLTADAGTQDIPCALLSYSEDYRSYIKLLCIIKEDLQYPVRGIVIDGDPGLVKAVKSVFPHTVYQLCIRHLNSYHNYYFKYQYHGSGVGVAEFLDISQKLLYAKDSAQLNYVYQQYLQFLERFEEGIDFKKILYGFESKFGHLWVHYKYRGLSRTTNIIEGIIRQLSRKIDDTDGFNYPKTAWNMLRLLIMRYRFKKFSCSRIKGNNGHCPLSLAGVKTKNLTWIKFSQK